MTQQTHRDVLYSLQHETPSKSLNDDAVKEIERLKHLAASVADQERLKCLCSRLREYVADVPNQAAAEIERMQKEIERLTRENGKSGIDPASFS
jgi:HAMP domain-containing protein